MPRRIDPLEGRRDALIAQVLWVATQLEKDTLARPWLLKSGCDPDAEAARLRHLEDAAREAVREAEHAARERKLPSLDTADLLAEVGAWQRETRLLLRLAGDDAPARRAAGSLRDTLRPTARRLAGSLAMLRAAVPTLRAEAQVLGPRVGAARLADQADALLTRLQANQADHNGKVDERAARVAEAEAAVEALRRALRVVRWSWRLAWDLSGRTIRRLDLDELAADVGSRPQRSKRTGRSRRANDRAQRADDHGSNTNDAAQHANVPGSNTNDPAQDANVQGSNTNDPTQHANDPGTD